MEIIKILRERQERNPGATYIRVNEEEFEAYFDLVGIKGKNERLFYRGVPVLLEEDVFNSNSSN